ncbi:hypothetical protein AgCh_001323 [Apium graveolens]
MMEVFDGKLVTGLPYGLLLSKSIHLKIENVVLVQVETCVIASSPIAGGCTSPLPGMLQSQLNEFMLEMRTNYKQLIKKMVEENKFLVLGLHTSATKTKSRPFPTSSTPGSVNLQDLCVATSKKLSKDYGLEDLFAKATTSRNLEEKSNTSYDTVDVLKFWVSGIKTQRKQ